MKRIFAVAALMIGSQLSAQDTTVLENVIVSANKFSTKTTETGKVVVVISRQDIEKAGSRDLSQVITELGGVFINGYTNNPGKEKNIYLRGAKVEHTLITVDGIPVYDASGIGSNFDIRYFPIDNVEKVEILKGSQGTLYGSDAIAGVINIITKKGGSKPTLNLNAHYGSFHTRRAGINYSGTKERFSYSLGYNHWSSDGFSEAKKPEGSTEEFDKDGYSQNNVQANFGYKASDQINILPFVRYSNNKGDLDQDAFTDEKDFTYEARNLQAGIKNSFRINKSQLNLIYQFQHIQRNYLDDSGSVNGYFIYNKSQYIAREHFAELIAVIPFENFRLTAGGDFRRSNTDFEAIQKNIFSPDIETPAYSGDSVQQDQKSFYASLNYNINSFNFEVGGRFNDHSAYGNNFAYNINPSYLINNRLKVYSNISSGYKVPSLYQLFSEYGNKDLQPEVSMNFEAGMQYFLKDKRSAFRAGVFKREVKDVIAFFFDPATFQSRYINQDKQDDKGLEVDAKLFFGNKFTITALYSYVDGEIQTRQNGKDTTYFNLLRRPQSILNVSFGAQLTPKLYLSTQLNAVGNSHDVYFDPATFQTSAIDLKNYVILNVYAEYNILKQLKIFTDFRNVTDSDYSDIYGYNTAGFNAYGGLRLRL
jgi:vitamin B12 transporter